MVLEKEIVLANDPVEEDEEEEEEEVDLIDPMDEVREKCSESSECQKLKEVLQACEDRVNSRTKTEETCDQELYDFLHARDHCVAHKIFSTMK